VRAESRNPPPLHRFTHTTPRSPFLLLSPPHPFPPPSQRHFGAAIGKGQRAAKTEIEKLKFSEKTVAESLGLVAKILVGVHDEAKDKPMEVELAWVCAASGWKYESVPKDKVAEAMAWAKAQLEAEEMGDDDDEED
jgi:20S proteasome subunit alpha 7